MQRRRLDWYQSTLNQTTEAACSAASRTSPTALVMDSVFSIWSCVTRSRAFLFCLRSRPIDQIANCSIMAKIIMRSISSLTLAP